MKLNTIPEILEDIRNGKMVILMDDEDRENEGDLIIAAEKVTAQDINFMARHACGLICLTLTEERCKLLRLPLMVYDNNAAHSTNFTVSIEAAEGVTTGISAADRAHTIKVAVDKDATAESIVQPGHIFPLMAKAGGVLSRAGHTEAGCDLTRLAGFEAASVIVEIMNQDGSMARRPDLEKFAVQHNLKIGTIADLIHYRILHEKTITRVSEQTLDTSFGEFTMVSYQSDLQKEQHIALIKGEIDPEQPTFVRVSRADTFRDLLGTQNRSHTSWSLPAALQRIQKEGSGVVVILANDDWASEALPQNPKAGQTIPGTPYTTVGTGSQILRDLNVRKMRLLSPPIKFAISGFDLEVVEYISPAE